MTNPEPHSVDILTHGRWVLVGNVQRWQGEHLEMPKPKFVRKLSLTCACGSPTHSPRSPYCGDCWLVQRQRSWRESRARRKESAA